MKFFSDNRDRFRQQQAASRHGVRKDHRRHHCPLPPARGVRDPFPDGQRRALAERVSQGGRAGEGSARLLRRDGAGVPRRLEAARPVVRRFHPHDRSQAAFPGGPEDGASLPGQRRHLRRRVRGLVLRRLRVVQAREGSRRGPVSDPQDQAAVDQGEELVLPPLEVSAAAPQALRRQPVVHRAGNPPQRDPAARRRRPRRHLDEPCRPVVGHPGAVRSRRAWSTCGSTR